MSIKTFKLGGIHPPEHKLSAHIAIERIPLPSQVTIPLGQHLGAPATPLVKKGETVKAGQLIAKANGFISANIHASISGKVFKIDNVIDASGYKKPAIIIKSDGNDEWEENIDQSTDLQTEITLSPKEIVDKINTMGIVGLGGATFPSFVKLMVPEGKKVEYLVINGVECEPYLTADHRVMLEHSHELMVGIKILMKALQVKKAVVGIENNKQDAIDKLSQLSNQYEDIEIVPLKVQYPQGGEKQLIQAVTGREVPSGKLPLEVGCVVNNVGTALAVYQAVQKNKPLFERVVTVTGKTVGQPKNILTRIGTPIKTLIEACECDLDNTGKFINGGPMMGKAVFNIDIPVTKGTSGILLMKRQESKRHSSSNCIRCAKCVDICPMGLEPVLLSKTSKLRMLDKVETERVMDCIECGSCSYTCPAHIPLLDHIRFGKSKVGAIIRNRNTK